MGYFHRIPQEIPESAVIDEAGFLTIFFRIMLPLAMPVTATATLLTFLNTWNAFFLPLMFSFSRPDLRTVSVGMLAFSSSSSCSAISSSGLPERSSPSTAGSVSGS